MPRNRPPEPRRPVAGQTQSLRRLGTVTRVDLESTSRKYRVTAATLIEWRDRFLAGGEGSLKSREAENELLREKIARLENGRPLALRKSKP